MTIANIGSALLGNLVGRQGDHSRHAVGERVELKVLRRADERRYLVAFRDGQHVVSSTVSLVVGSTVRAVVTAVGEKLELRYVGADAVATAMEDHEAAGEDSLAELAARYAVELHTDEHSAIEQAMQDATDPGRMAAGGIFLSKLALPVDTANLKALYAAQRWPASAPAAPAGDTSALDAEAQAGLAEQMLSALKPEVQSESESTSSDRERQHELAQRLLNQQDDGSVAYRFGVLPVLVGDQLLELDLVHFRERRGSEGAPGLRRLVMTFSTSTLGRVEVLAQALDDRLTVSVRTDSAQSRETLAARAGEVRELVARLGWNVETVSYDFDTGVNRAARQVLDHVLNADTLSRLV